MDLTELRYTLGSAPVVVPHHLTIPKTITIQYGLSYHVGGDFNQGCVYEGITCQGISYPSANLNFFVDDTRASPVKTIVIEETWTSTSPVCAKSLAIDLYNPDAPSVTWPNRANPHYWTNYPHAQFTSTNPIVMVIPRNETGNADSIDDPDRVRKNDGYKLYVRGNWTLRNFPTGKGLTNLAADVNCITDQKFDLYWTSFFVQAAPIAFQARP